MAFASELRSFLVDPDFRAELSEEAIALYLSLGYVPDPHCIFAGVHKLPPGHLLTWTGTQGVSVERYWSPARAEVTITLADAVEELRRILDSAVRSHLESEVPLGAFLSGGIDSSTVVALIARATDRNVRTFSIGLSRRHAKWAPTVMKRLMRRASRRPSTPIIPS